MENLFKALEVLNKVYDDIRKIEDKTAFMSFIGTLVDQWAADHGLDSETTCGLLRDIVKVQAEVHNEFGMMET